MKNLMILLCVLAFAGALSAEEPFAGTWKLNLAKSKYPPGTAPKEVTATIREIGGGQVEQTVTGTTPDGKPIAVKQTVNQTGGVWKFQQGGPPTGTLAVAVKVGDRDVYNVTYVGEKQVQLSHSVVSKDGKTINTTAKGIDPQGKLFESMQVLERQ
jgi:hypothetical protein